MSILTLKHKILMKKFPKLENKLSELTGIAANDDYELYTNGLNAAGIFDVNAYLAVNEDVARSGIDPLRHFIEYGLDENRRMPLLTSPSSNQTRHPSSNGTANIFLFGDGARTEAVVRTFSGIEKLVSFVVSNKAKPIIDLPTAQYTSLKDMVQDRDIFVLDNVEHFERQKMKLHNDTGAPMGSIIKLHDFLIDNIENGLLYLRPVRAQIDASTLCNLDCADCYMRKNNNGAMGSGYLKAVDFQNFLDANQFIRSIELSNSGETFLNPEIDKIIDIAAERNVNLTFINGVNFNYLKENVAEKLVKSGAVSDMRIAIDGVSQSVYETYRRKGRIANVFENIKLVNYYKRKYNTSKPHMIWQYVLFNHNEHEAEIASFVASTLDMDIMYKTNWNGSFKPRDPEKLEKITKIRFTPNSSRPAAPVNFFINDNTCYQLIFSPQINWDGRLLGCCYIYRSDWGRNVFKENFLEVINANPYLQSVKMLLGGGPVKDSSSLCMGCGHYKAFEEAKMIRL